MVRNVAHTVAHTDLVSAPLTTTPEEQWWSHRCHTLLLDALRRAQLLERTGQSSLPHVFVGGDSIGGLYSGTPGLVALKKQGKLAPMLKEAGAL